MKVISYKEEKEDDEEMQEITNECIHPQKKKNIKKIQVKEREKEQKKKDIQQRHSKCSKKRLLCIYLKWNIFFHFSCLTHLLFSSYSYFVNLFFSYTPLARSTRCLMLFAKDDEKERKKKKV